MSPVQPPLPAVPPPTRQLPVVPPPASGSTAVASPTAPAAGAVPTGPVDWMPMPPEPGAVPSGPRAAPGPAVPDDHRVAAEPGDAATGRDAGAPARRRVRFRLPRAARTPRGGRVTAVAVLGAGALLLLELGLLVHEDGTTLWARVPLWAAFATAAAVVGLAAVAGLRTGAALRDRAWAVGAGGLTGLAVFWLLVVLPSADTDRGFVLTAALACLGGCLWLTAGRSRTARDGDGDGDGDGMPLAQDTAPPPPAGPEAPQHAEAQPEGTQHEPAGASPLVPPRA